MTARVAVRPALAAAAGALCVLVLALAGAPARAGCIPARQLFETREAGKVAFRQPADLVVGGERLLVLDDLNGRVALLDLQGRSVGSIPLPGGSAEPYRGIGFGGADQIFLAASGRGMIVVLDARGKVVREFPVGDGGEEARPAGVLVSRASLFVADSGQHRVRGFTLEGGAEASWGGRGEGPRQFRTPFRIAQDSLDRVFVTDALNSRVQVFTPKGEPLLSFGEFGVTEGTLFRPAGIAILEGDRVVVSDNYFGSLQVFDASGAYQGVLCGPGGRPLALENPTGVAARGRTVYVVESGGRVSGYEIGGR